jgi:5-methylcytosine-specific restriction endonuclease McrA
MNKTCTKCHTEKPLSEFHKAKSGKYGLTSTCKPCAALIAKKWYEKNREHTLAVGKVWASLHPDKKRAQGQRYDTTHRETRQEQAKAYRAANPDKLKEQRAAYKERHPNRGRDYYAKNIEQERARSHAKYIKCKEHVQEYQRQYHALNPGLKQEWKRVRRARVKAAPGTITNTQWAALLDQYGHKCLCCGATDVKLTLDHVIPLTCGGTHTVDNAQPLCVPCNSTKHTQTIDYRG